MRKKISKLSRLAVLCLIAGILSCSGSSPDDVAEPLSGTDQLLLPKVRAFHVELDNIRQQLDAPGLAYAIIHDARIVSSRGLGVDAEGNGEPFTTSTPFPVASITKNLTATIVMQLVEEEKLALDAPVSEYLPNVDLPVDISLRHLLAHTSEGIPGQEYVYGSSRFSLIGDVIESVTSNPLEVVFQRRIFSPAKMEWYDSPRLAAHYGLTSTVDDLARYVQALDEGFLLDDTSLASLGSPSLSSQGQALPVGIGWFAQDIQGVRVTWSYGQDESPDVSALLLRVPDCKLSLVMIANTAYISDIFRLLMGDVRQSPIAMSFFRLFVASPESGLLPPPGTLAELRSARVQSELRQGDYSYRHELLGRAHMEFFNDNEPDGHALLEIAHRKYDLLSEPDPVLHFYLASYDQPEWLQKLGIEMGDELLATHPNNRWILSAQARLLRKTGSSHAAGVLHLRVTQLPNQNDDFLHRLINTWSWQALAEINRDIDPGQSLSFLQLILDSGVGGEARENAMRLMSELQQPPDTN